MTPQADSVPSPDSAREEAERLVAAGLAAVSMAADRIGAPTRERGGAAAAGFDALGDVLFGPSGQRRHTVANDSDECCRCPVCRVISAARAPDPDLAERLATRAGDAAEGAARLLRAVVGEAPRAGRAERGASEPGDHWAAATAAEDTAAAESTAADGTAADGTTAAEGDTGR